MSLWFISRCSKCNFNHVSLERLQVANCSEKSVGCESSLFQILLYMTDPSPHHSAAFIITGLTIPMWPARCVGSYKIQNMMKHLVVKWSWTFYCAKDVSKEWWNCESFFVANKELFISSSVRLIIAGQWKLSACTYIRPGNTKRGSITALLTSCFTGFD